MSQVNKVYFGEDKIIGYSEKNLCPVFDLIPNGEKGITYIRNRDGSIRIFGTATARSVCYIIPPSSLYNMPAGTYSYTMGTKLPEGVGVCFEYYDETGNTWIGNYGNLNYWKESHTTDFIENTSLSIYISINEGTKVNLTLYPQIEASTTLSSYEPYEIHQSIAKKPEGLKKIYIGDENGLAKLIYKGIEDINNAIITLGPVLTYNGTEQTQTVSSIVLRDKTLIEGTDYTISNNTATNAGSYTLIITGINDYEGTTAVAWNIAKATGNIIVSPTSLSIIGATNSTATATITHIGDGEINVISNDVNIATVDRTDNVITVKSVMTGSTTIVITLAEGMNYTGGGCTINVTTNTAIFGGYTGSYSDLGAYTISNSSYNIYRLTTAGTLTLNGDAKVWLCGGGGAGGDGMANDMGGTSGGGGGGGGGYVKSGTLEAASYSIVIGSGASYSTYDGGTTQILKNSKTLYSTQGGKGGTDGYRSGNAYYGGTGGAGGSGGGGGGLSINEWYRYGLRGSGAGTSTYPFGLTGLYAHSAGGGGGGTNSSYGGGWYGGSNGANGSGRISSSNSDSSGTQAGSYTGGTGGEKGGGNGGTARGSVATPGSFYGSGGGGGHADSATGTATANGGSGKAGYQGTVYIAVPT